MSPARPALPDRAKSRVVLVGVSAYQRMPHIPHVLNNITDLRDTLGGEHGLFDDASVTQIADPESPAKILGPLAEISKQCRDTLIFYFAGHGVRDMDDALCLALPGTVDRKADAQRTALPVESVVSVLNNSPARKRVAIFDCCFSGLAMRAPSAFNLHLLTAAGRNEKAKALPNHRNTEFTAHLLDLLRTGIPDGGPVIDMNTAYRHLAVTLGALSALDLESDVPKPHQRAVDLSGDTALARNPAVGSALTEAGLWRRATFADRVGHAGDPAEAARLFGRIVVDGINDKSAAEFRKAEAAWTGTAGDVIAAVAKWEHLYADLRATFAEPAELAEVEQSLAYWRSHSRE